MIKITINCFFKFLLGLVHKSQTWYSYCGKFASLQWWSPLCPDSMICRKYNTLLWEKKINILHNTVPIYQKLLHIAMP